MRQTHADHIEAMDELMACDRSSVVCFRTLSQNYSTNHASLSNLPLICPYSLAYIYAEGIGLP